MKSIWKFVPVVTGVVTALAGNVHADNMVPSTYGTMTYIFDGVLMVIGGLIHGVTLQSTTIGSAMGMTIALGMLAALVGSVVTVFAALIALAYISRDKGKKK